MHEVAKLSGFPSYAVFARIFRQDLGMTPSQFQAGLGMGAVDTNPRSDGGA
jgi:AraC-like DNA-binding protein